MGWRWQIALDDDRDEFFRELVGAVVVGAIGGDHRQAVGVVIGAHQQVAGGLAGGVGRIGRVGRGFGKIAGRAQAAIDFIGGNMMEAAARMADARMAGSRVEPERAAGLQKIEGANDVGLNKVAGAGDGAVHMGFGGQMQDMGDGMVLAPPRAPPSLSRKSVFSKAYLGWCVDAAPDSPGGRRRSGNPD